MPSKAIARVLGVSRNTAWAALATAAPPKLRSQAGRGHRGRTADPRTAAGRFHDAVDDRRGPLDRRYVGRRSAAMRQIPEIGGVRLSPTSPNEPAVATVTADHTVDMGRSGTPCWVAGAMRWSTSKQADRPVGVDGAVWSSARPIMGTNPHRSVRSEMNRSPSRTNATLRVCPRQRSGTTRRPLGASCSRHATGRSQAPTVVIRSSGPFPARRPRRHGW